MIDEKTLCDLLYLCNCSLHEAAPEIEIVSKMDLPTVRRIAEQHKIAALVGMGIQNMHSDPSTIIGESEWDSWNELINRSVRRTMLFDEERSEICAWFEEQGIWYLPLKGILIKEMYPAYGMREYADNDILVDPAYSTTIKTFMTKRGYEYKTSRNGVHDDYLKEPFFHFEIHHKLFTEITMQGILGRYYKNVFKQLISKNGTYEMAFSDNDAYVYIICHDYRHYRSSGTGLRTVTDAFILNQYYKYRDRKYCEEELRKNEADLFEKELMRTAGVLFDSVHYPEMKDLTEEQQKMLLYMAESKAYGTIELRLKNEMRRIVGNDKGKNAKLTYLWHRIFPDLDYMSSMYKSLKKYPWLLPLFHLVRLFDRVLTVPEKWINELKALKKI